MESVSTGTFATPQFVRGDGCWLYDGSGEAYFDGTAGSGAVGLGHNHPRVAEAVRRQLDRLVHTGCKFGSDARAALVEKLVALAPFADAAVLPTVTGAEAVESALKVARAHTGRRAVVCFRHGYHGKTAGALSLTWRDRIKRYSNLPDGVSVADFPSPVAADGEIDRALVELRRSLDGAAAVILEPVQVTEGVLCPGARFLEEVVDAAHAAGALAVFDEIYTGLGRCGAPFYCQRLRARPDLVLAGKTLGNGMPISAVLGPSEIVNALPAGVQTSTYTGHPLSCAAAASVLDFVVETRLWEEAARLGEQLLSALRRLAGEARFIARPRGEGLLLAFDCVDGAGRPAPQTASRYLAAALRARLLLFGGGADDATIKLVPPMVMKPGDLDRLVERLAQAAFSVQS